MKAYKAILALLLVLVAISAISVTLIKTVSAEKALTVTVSTDKPVYTIEQLMLCGKKIDVTFYVTRGGRPVEGAAVWWRLIHDGNPTYEHFSRTDSNGKTREHLGGPGVAWALGSYKIEAKVNDAKGTASFTIIEQATSKVPATKEKEVKKRIFGRAFLDDKTHRYPYGALRNAKVELKHNGNIYKDYTDDGGFFEFDAEVEKDDQITLTLYLEDEVNGKNYIKIFDKQSRNPSDPVYIEKTCRITDEDLRNGIDFIFDKDSTTSGYRSGSSSSVLPGLVKEYIIFEDAVAFALEKLKTDIHNVSIHANNPNAKTECKSHSEENSACYDPTTRQIILGPNYVKLWPTQDSGFLSPYTEFHEFGHHIMFCHKEYLRDISYQVISHGGMMNPTTHDSLCEGEADFMALLMYEYKSHIISKFAKPGSVMGGKNFEVNYKAWLMEGNISREDIAVASLLWDLYDVEKPKHPERLDDKHFPSQNKVYDEFELSLQDMWSILKSSNCINVWNLYIVLTNRYPPADKQKIDDLFIAHGFFRDKERGNGSYDGPATYVNVTMEGKWESIYFCGEPYHDKNNNGVRDANEPFVDLGHGHKFPGGQVYNADEDVVGTASNYLMFGTPTKVGRQIGPIVKNSYILVKNEETQEFLVKVEFEPEYSYYNYEYMTSSHEGLLYISFPPPEYKTTVTITPISENYVAEKPLKIESEEYFDLISKSTDENHFLEHEFDLQPIKEAYVLGLTFESRSKSSGSTVQIPLTLRGIEEKIGNMDITLSYDPSVLDAKEVIKGSLTTKSLFDYNILEGTIKISLADEEGFSGDGSIAHVKFNVIGAEGSSSPLTIVAIAANKAEDYETLEVPTNDGVFRVISMEESRGDGDGDGGFTALDALYALQMAVGKIPEDLAMDMNGDGSVTSLDAQKILKIAVGEE